MSKQKFSYGIGHDKELLANLSHTNPLEFKEKTISGMKRLFPFWKPVDLDDSIECHDVDEVFALRSEWHSNAKKFGNSTPLQNMQEMQKQFSTKQSNKIWSDNSSALASIKGWMEKAENKVGIVEPKLDDAFKVTASNKIQTTFDNSAKVTVEKSVKSNLEGGKVTPKVSDDLKKTATKAQLTSVDWTKDQPIVIEKAVKTNLAGGKVVPKVSDDLKKTATTTQVIKNDTTTGNTVVVEKAGKSTLAGGKVVPKVSDDLKKTASK